MNLRTVQFWKKSAGTATKMESQPHEDHAKFDIAEGKRTGTTDNVVQLPTLSDNGGLAYDHLGRNCISPASAFVRRYEGLLNASELIALFEENHFGLGRHNGAQYKTQEALELGKSAIVAKFQNVVQGMVERNQTKLNKVQSELIAIEGVSLAMSAQLRLLGEHVRRDIRVLESQIESAESGKGWILESLNRYHLGFTKGLREVLEFEVLTR